MKIKITNDSRSNKTNKHPSRALTADERTAWGGWYVARLNEPAYEPPSANVVQMSASDSGSRNMYALPSCQADEPSRSLASSAAGLPSSRSWCGAVEASPPPKRPRTSAPEVRG